MFRWLRRLFGGSNEPTAPIKVEVTINVPTIHVFVHGSQAGEISETPESRSMLSPGEKRASTDNQATFAEDDQLSKLSTRLRKIETPKVPFGEEPKPPAV